MSKECSRCGSSSQCLESSSWVNEDIPTQLSESTKLFLPKTKFERLCMSCLEDIQAIVESVISSSYSTDVSIEGIHYYYDGPYRVMTEYYHIARGYCCGSGCRHCAYGFRKSEIV